MFGINDDDKKDKAADPPVDGPASNPQPAISASGPAASNPPVNPISGNQTLGPPQISNGLPSIIPGTSATPLPSAPAPKKKLLASLPQQPAAFPPTPAMPSMPVGPAPVKTPPAVDSIVAGNLLDIKKEALQNLTPLVDKLDQPPEEKFKTLMMLLQASDNSALINDVYQAANQIADEKTRAQALLDVVNEINYFTQNSKQ